jgi:uncharacterized membrane protein
MTTALSLIARKAEMLGLRIGLDTGGAKVLFYTNTPPVLPDTATTETLLGTITLAAPCGTLGESGVAPAPVYATLTITVPQVAAAVATGIIGWVRFTNGAGNGFMDLPVGVAGSGMPVIVNVLQVYANGEIRLASCVLMK